MSAPDLNSRRDELEKILRRATPLLMEGYTPTPGSDPRRKALLGTRQKTSHRDLVTVFDKKVEEFIVGAFAKSFPGEAIVGEEGSSDKKAAGLRALCEGHDAFWVIDPIDGTTNYSRAYPFFCCTAAFIARNKQGLFEVQAGALWNPIAQEMFTAAAGSGAWLNRTRLSVTTVEDPQEALLATGFGGLRTTEDEIKSFERFARITRLTLGVRRDGSAALDLAYVAAGRFDGYWEKGLSPWDVAAGVLFIQESKGRVTHHDGSALDILSGEILSSNGFLHKWLQDTIKV